MKVLELDFPKIKIDVGVMARLEMYAKTMKKRGLIIGDCVIGKNSDEYTITNVYVPKQTWDYTKNAQKYEEVHEEIGYYNTEDGGFAYVQCMIRVELSKNSSITDEDFKYFESLCDVSDFLIVGDITQPDKDKAAILTLYYLDLEHRVAVSYGSPYQDKGTHDKQWELSFGTVSEKEIKDEIQENCSDKKYSYSSNNGYGSYGNYGGSGYYNNTQKTEVKVEKSELNKKDPSINSLVSTGKS